MLFLSLSTQFHIKKKRLISLLRSLKKLKFQQACYKYIKGLKLKKNVKEI